MAHPANDNTAPYHLLLLPDPPSDASAVNIDAAYGAAIRSVIKSTQSNNTTPTQLDIAVHCPVQGASDRTARTYGHLEKVVASLYSLIVSASSENGTSLNVGEMPDVAIFFFEDPPKDNSDNVSIEHLRNQRGPIVSLQTLASSQRGWTHLYVTEGEAMKALLENFMTRRRSLEDCITHTTSRVPTGSTAQQSHVGKTPAVNAVSKHHASVAVGGTFDHLHAGHKLLLTATALALEGPSSTKSSSLKHTLTIGITGDELLKNKKYAQHLESWAYREQAVHRFLERILNFSTSRAEQQRFNEPGPNGKAIRSTYTYHDTEQLILDCVELSDPFGPTITQEFISALVVSAETRAGGKAVNDKRKEKGWEELEVFEVDVLDSNPSKSGEASATTTETGFQTKISSTEIRRVLQEKESGGGGSEVKG